MTDGHLTNPPDDETGSGFESEAMPIGLADELAGFLGDLPGDAAFDVATAVATAAQRHQAMINADAEAGERAAREDAVASSSAVEAGEQGPDVDGEAGVVVVIGGRPTTLVLGDEIIVGRSGTHRVEHPAVSRRHLCLRVTPGGLHCHDLGSANGSWLVRTGNRTALGRTDIPVVASDRIVTGGNVEILHVPGGQ